MKAKLLKIFTEENIEKYGKYLWLTACLIFSIATVLSIDWKHHNLYTAAFLGLSIGSFLLFLFFQFIAPRIYPLEKKKK